MSWGDRVAEQHEKDQPSELLSHCAKCHRIAAVYLGRHGIFCPDHGSAGCPVERGVANDGRPQD